LTCGESTGELRNLAAGGTGFFLLACVALPSLLGVVGRRLVGGAKIDAARPELKLVNSGILLQLNYVNGAVSLPQAVAYPDWDFLALILAVSVALCVTAFASGWWLGRLLGADRPRRTALMFGLGMNNNGSGLVLAGLALTGLPQAMLPILVYNLVQHLMAGGATFLLSRNERRTLTEKGTPCSLAHKPARGFQHRLS
jgi:BASS family bile acid:Na+ symporter